MCNLSVKSVSSDLLVYVSSSITAVLSNKCGFQLQYQMIFCVWLLAFSPQLCEQLRRYNVVPALSDILQESVKEKVTRIILAAFRVSRYTDKLDKQRLLELLCNLLSVMAQCCCCIILNKKT